MIFFKRMLCMLVLSMSTSFMSAMELEKGAPSSAASYVSQDTVAHASQSKISEIDNPISLKALYDLPAEIQHLVSLYHRITPEFFKEICQPFAITYKEKCAVMALAECLKNKSYPIGTILAFYYLLTASSQHQTFKELVGLYLKKIASTHISVQSDKNGMSNDSVYDMFFSPDGTYLITLSLNKSPVIWYAKNGKLRGVVEGFEKFKEYHSVDWSDAKQLTVSVGEKNKFYLTETEYSEQSKKYLESTTFFNGRRECYGRKFSRYVNRIDIEKRRLAGSVGYYIPSSLQDHIDEFIYWEPYYKKCFKGNIILSPSYGKPLTKERGYDFSFATWYDIGRSCPDELHLYFLNKDWLGAHYSNVEIQSDGKSCEKIVHAMFNETGSKLAVVWKNATGDNYVRIYAIYLYGKLLNEFLSKDAVNNIAFDDKNDVMAVASRETIKLFNLTTSACLGEIREGEITGLTFMPHGRMLLGCTNKPGAPVFVYGIHPLEKLGEITTGDDCLIRAMKLNFQGTKLAVSMQKKKNTMDKEEVVIYEVAKLNKELSTSKTGLNLYKKKLKQRTKQARKESKEEIED